MSASETFHKAEDLKKTPKHEGALQLLNQKSPSQFYSTLWYIRAKRKRKGAMSGSKRNPYFNILYIYHLKNSRLLKR